MTEDNLQAAYLALFALWFGVKVSVCLSFLIFSQEGVAWALISWFVLNLAKPQVKN